MAQNTLLPTLTVIRILCVMGRFYPKNAFSDRNGTYLSALTRRSYVVPIPGFSFRLLVPHIPVLHSLRQLRGSGSPAFTRCRTTRKEKPGLYTHNPVKIEPLAASCSLSKCHSSLTRMVSVSAMITWTRTDPNQGSSFWCV